MNEELDLFEIQEEKQQDPESQATVAEPWVEDGQSTLMGAFIYLTREVENKGHMGSRRSMTLDTSDNEALHYLMRRLNLTATQVHILACVLFQCEGLGMTCDMDDLTDFLGSHPLKMYMEQENLNQLIELGYVEKDDNRLSRSTQYSIRKEAMEALSRNQAFELTMLHAPDSITLLAQCATAIREGRQHDSDGNIEKKINWLFQLNRHLPIVMNIERIAGDDSVLFMSLVLAASLIGAESAACFDLSDFNMVFELSDVRKLSRAIQRGRHPLVEKNILEPLCNGDGMANADQWVITKAGWMELLSNNQDEVNTIIGDYEEWGRKLMPHTLIPERKLYFSGKTEEEVNRLRQLLQDDQYQQVVARLKEKNMPTGLNILLYGTPGTGKTELVQQLARETGRDIFFVDMSQIRNKYVGQSEQNLAEVFSYYRTYVSRMRKTPILFCNECDAIFGSRLEHTTHSVDKMENALQNILLEQMEKMQGIMICTTNLTSALDKAFERRFLLKIQLPKPNNEARKQIWATMLPGLNDEQATELADRFDFSGGQIQNVTRKQIINSIFSGTDEMDFERILDDCTAETMDRSNGRQIGFK